MRFHHTLAPIVLAVACQAAQVPVWTTGTGTTTIVVQQDFLSSLGAEIRTGTGVVSSAGFALTEESDIKFVTPWGSPDSFLGGSLRCDGGIEFRCIREGETNVLSIEPLELFALKDTELFELRDDDSEPVFVIDHFDVRFDPGLHLLSLNRGNLRIARQCAERLGRPELGGLVIGTVDCLVEVNELAARIDRSPRVQPSYCRTPPGTNALLRIKSIEAVQQTSAATGDAVRVSFAFTLENAGPDSLALQDVPTTSVALRLVQIEGSLTQTVVEAAQTIRVDPAEKCPCAETFLLHPGEASRWTLADAIAAGAAIQIPLHALEGDAGNLMVEAELGGETNRCEMLMQHSGGLWRFDLKAPAAASPSS